MRDPFLNPGKSYGAVDAASRIDRVRDFSRDECLAALFLDDQRQYLQSTVRAAIARRLRALERELAEPLQSPDRLRRAGAK